MIDLLTLYVYQIRIIYKQFIKITVVNKEYKIILFSIRLGIELFVYTRPVQFE